VSSTIHCTSTGSATQAQFALWILTSTLDPRTKRPIEITHADAPYSVRIRMIAGPVSPDVQQNFEAFSPQSIDWVDLYRGRKFLLQPVAPQGPWQGFVYSQTNQTFERQWGLAPCGASRSGQCAFILGTTFEYGKYGGCGLQYSFEYPLPVHQFLGNVSEPAPRVPYNQHFGYWVRESNGRGYNATIELNDVYGNRITYSESITDTEWHFVQAYVYEFAIDESGPAQNSSFNAYTWNAVSVVLNLHFHTRGDFAVYFDDVAFTNLLDLSGQLGDTYGATLGVFAGLPVLTPVPQPPPPPLGPYPYTRVEDIVPREGSDLEIWITVVLAAIMVGILIVMAVWAGVKYLRARATNTIYV